MHEKIQGLAHEKQFCLFTCLKSLFFRINRVGFDISSLNKVMQSANHTRASKTKQSAGIRRVWSNVTDTKRGNSARVVK